MFGDIACMGTFVWCLIVARHANVWTGNTAINKYVIEQRCLQVYGSNYNIEKNVTMKHSGKHSENRT